MAKTGTSLGIGERRSIHVALGALAWIVSLLFFFPIFWVVISSLKNELDAVGDPKVIFTPSLDRYREVTDTTQGILSFKTAISNSASVVLFSTAIVLIMAIPAAYALAIRPVKKWRDVLLFFISTKFLPMVASILPLYILAKEFDLLGTRTVLVILYTAMNLPLAEWMLRSFFQEVPRELVEAAEIDGASLWAQLKSVILPIAAPGIAATALLCMIFAWNEFFFALQLNSANAQTIPIWVTTNISEKENFLAKLSAASVIASLPVVIAGWIAQKRMIRGLAMGAIK